MPRLIELRLKKNIYWIVLIGFLLEIITSFFRFYYKIESTRDTAFLANYTFHLRIHHGYLGIILIIIGMLIKNIHKADLLYRIGGAFILSDLIHHFVVLWISTGSPHFDFVYP